MASSPSSESSLRSTINTALHRTIFENNDDDDPATTTLLYDLLYGNTNTNIAVHELIVSATGTKDADDFFSSLSIQILYLAAEYPFLQPQLQALVERTIASPNAAASDFTSSMAVTLSDTIQSLHAQLFEQKNKTKDHIDDYINLHRFTARIIAISTPTADMADRAVSGIDDALYVLSTALEAHPDSHNFLDAVVGAAAQYVIHAGSALFEVCRKRLGHDLAEKSPLWATRGKNWTGTAGMSLERWDFWKGRFQAVASSEAREENKKIAQTAVGAMEIVESAGEG